LIANIFNRILMKAHSLLRAGLVVAATAGAVFGQASSHAHGINGFTGPYEPANWTYDGGQGNGSVDTSGTPDSLKMTGSNNGFADNTDYTSKSVKTGHVTFNYAYTSADDDGFDGFGYLLNGAYTELASNDNVFGSAFFNLVDGDTFGFRLTTLDATNGPGSISITNFTAPGNPHHDADPAPSSVPGPLSILGATAAFGWSRKLRRRLVLN
jgi:hypothetical protein